MAGPDTLTFSEADFEQHVVQSDVPVLVDFWAEWCGPCIALSSKIDELATEYVGKAKVGKVDLDSNQNLASKYGVSAIPTLLVLSGGEVKERIVGLRGKKDIADVLDAVIAGS